ncbi:AAA family ATPase [Rhizobium sp. 1399]|uniref:AAA family ATPase n=1 Tax=Rhizobium sp. 1399 TaxID=2817758 RepID=UPI0028638E9E|nr:AAA family ATPase [Rhizobium sp. 1399]MDR6667079.1 hypothetical protein [Rhizobium sp. 1399]
MRSFNFAERASTIEVHTYALSVRTALRRCKVFIQGNRVVGLRLPPDAALEAYKDAVELVLKGASLNNYVITTITTFDKGNVDTIDALYQVRFKAAVVVLVQHSAEVPGELVVALDRIVDVVPMHARHLVAAAKSAAAMDLPLETARNLASYPARLVFLALRPGRPLDDVLARLRAHVETPPKQPVKAATWEPRVEELEGYGAARNWAIELIADLRDYREKRIPWSDVASCILLAGPSGTGKTLFAQALARSCEAHFIATSTAAWQAKGHLGDMLRAMRRSFEQAVQSGPTVLLIDEIDAIGDRRQFSGHNADYNVQVVNALLELLDGSGGREGVIVVATTNHPQNIDPALKRPGRLDREVIIELPDRSARGKMLELHLGSSLPAKDLHEAAAATSGYSGADLAQAAKDARRAARRKGRGVEIDDLMSLLPPVTAITGDERWEACVHEAGHAIVGLELEVGELEMVVVAKAVGHRDMRVGHVQWRRTQRRSRARQAYLNEIAMMFGGMAAEEVLLGDIQDGSGGVPGSDLQRACDMATRMLGSLGLGALQFYDLSSSSDLEKLRRANPALRKRVERLLAAELDRAIDIIRKRTGDVELIAEAVFERGVITGSEVEELIAPKRKTG